MLTLVTRSVSFDVAQCACLLLRVLNEMVLVLAGEDSSTSTAFGCVRVRNTYLYATSWNSKAPNSATSKCVSDGRVY